MPSPHPPLASAPPPLPPIDLDSIDPDHRDLPYEDRLLEAMTPRMRVLLSIGRAAYKAKQAEVGDVGTAGIALVAIEVSKETKPTIRWLLEEGDARFCTWNVRCEVTPRAFLTDDDVPVQGLTVQLAGCHALAEAFRSVGVPCRVKSMVD